MPNMTIVTNSGFDLHSVGSAMDDEVKNWDEVVGKPQLIKGDDGFIAPLGDGYSLKVFGEVNKNFTKGDPEKITLLKDGKALVDFTDFNMPLSEFLFGTYLAKTIGGLGVTLGEALAGTLLSQTNKKNPIAIFGGGGGDVLYYIGDPLGNSSGRLFGRAGDDTMEDHVRQANKYDGETGKDTVSYSAINTAVTVNLTDATKNTGEALGDTYRSIENVIGTSQDDTITGTKVKNELRGEIGNDTLIGGADADILNGGDGTDFASYDGSLVGVTVNLADSTANTGDAKGDTFISIEGLVGSAQNDTLTGDASANVIYGGRGDDVIDSGGGNDELWGDSEEFGVDGDDTFIFHGPGTASDVKRIMDFDVFDHIQIDRAGGFGLHPLWVLNVGTTLIIAHADPAATTNSPTFLVEQSTGNLYFDADGNGSGAKQLIANVQFHSQEYLDISDFVIV